MDQGLKARLIGASILVLLAVLLLPELLSGPHNAKDSAAVAGKGTRTVVIDLGGGVPATAQLQPRAETSPQPAAAPAVPMKSERPAATVADVTQVPVDASAPAMNDGPEGEPPVSASPLPAPRPESTPTPDATVPAAQEPRTATASGGYSVQVGAFGSAAAARKLVNDLKVAGMPAYLVQPAPGKKLHRVRVGPVADRAAADKLAAKLKARGLPVAVVADG